VHWRLRVPASTSNLGPGFDCLGLALDLDLRVDVERPAHAPGIVYEGTQPPADNLFVRALHAAGGVAPDTRVVVASAIPSARGLGSSAAAIVAGIATAHLAGDGSVPAGEDLVSQALALEGHPDNLAAAVQGGLVGSVVERENARVMPLALAADWSFVLVIPERGVATAAARAILPARLERDDAVYNLQRLAFLIGALAQGDATRLRYGLADRLHQDRRLALVPGLGAALAALASEPGCAGAALSGSGPTLLGFVHAGAGPRPSGATAVAALAGHGIAATVVHARAAAGVAWERVAGST